MPRKGPATRREIVGDPIYKSVLVTQFVNKILQRGKRSTAERIMYDALDLVQEKTGDDPVSVLKRAVDNVRPLSLRFAAAVSVARPTRCPLRSAPAAPPRSRSVGWSASLVIVVSARWPSAWPTKFSTPATASARRASVVKISRRWRKPTRPSPTTAGSAPTEVSARALPFSYDRAMSFS